MVHHKNITVLLLLSRIFIPLKPDSVRRKRLDDRHTFYCIDYFVLGEIRTCLGASSDPMFPWILSNSCPLNLLRVRSHQAKTFIVKRLIQVRNNVTRVRA